MDDGGVSNNGSKRRRLIQYGHASRHRHRGYDEKTIQVINLVDEEVEEEGGLINTPAATATTTTTNKNGDGDGDRKAAGAGEGAGGGSGGSSSSSNAMWFPSSDKIDYSQQPPPLPPNRPTQPASQKAATMSTEPDQEKVEMFMAFVGNVDRATAVRYLKAKHNNVEAAVNAMLDGEDIAKSEAASTWDETAWSNDRDAITSDQYLHPLGASSAAATRPNSPASSLARQNIRPTTKTEEDEDFAKAMEASQTDIGGGLAGQETGRIGTDGQEARFGPATKRDYDEQSWGIVPFSLQDNTDEVVPDADAADRVNRPGQPRLLKHLPSGDYIAAFLTICHSIPGAREAMLMRDHVQPGYGEDPDWWRGHPISMPTIVHISDGSAVDPDRDRHDEILDEVQRLMAFLGSSDRSYASVGPLTQTAAIKNSSPAVTRSKTLMELFVQSWTSAVASKLGPGGGALGGLFITTVGTNAPDGMDTPEMNLVDLPVNIPEGETSDLLERLDDLLWDADSEELLTSDNFIERPADVVVVRVYQQNSTEQRLRMEVPPYFYIDKYMPQNVEATRDTRRQMAKGRKRIAKIEEIEKKLKTWKHPRTNATIDAKRLLSHTLGHFSGENRAKVLAADKSYTAPADGETEQQLPPHYADVAQKLQTVIASIDQKLVALADEKEKTRKAVADLSKSPPPGLLPDDLQHRYTLRGVATKPNITYVLSPADPASDEPDLFDDEHNTPEGLQWWRLEYDVNASGSGAKITKTPTPDYEVLRAVELEHRSALLVYASDRIQAQAAEQAPLPPALQDFINHDNALFEQELAHERSKPPSYAVDMTDVSRDDVRPSIELSRRGSTDSTRVEGGDSRVPSPEYDDFAAYPSMPAHVGLGYDLTPHQRSAAAQGEDDEAPVHEIRLPDDDDEGIGMEMEETTATTGPMSDAVMLDGNEIDPAAAASASSSNHNTTAPRR